MWGRWTIGLLVGLAVLFSLLTMFCDSLFLIGVFIGVLFLLIAGFMVPDGKTRWAFTGLIFLTALFGAASLGHTACAERRLVQNSVEVAAQVTAVEWVFDGEDGEEERYYVSYEYNGVPYRDVYWLTGSPRAYTEGERVTVSVNPATPGSTVTTASGVLLSIFSAVLCAMAVGWLVICRKVLKDAPAS